MSEVREGPRELLISTGVAELGDVLVAVSDSGPGLSPASLARVFAAFYTTKPGGLGMGLSICRSIIEAHGGRLWAAPDEPRGAAFSFTLPIEERWLEKMDQPVGPRLGTEVPRHRRRPAPGKRMGTPA
jgi:signal transduction histidine kinase